MKHADYLVSGYGPFVIVTAWTSKAAAALLQWREPDYVVASHNCRRFCVFAGSEANIDRSNAALAECINTLRRQGCEPHFGA